MNNDYCALRGKPLPVEGTQYCRECGDKILREDEPAPKNEKEAPIYKEEKIENPLSETTGQRSAPPDFLQS